MTGNKQQFFYELSLVIAVPATYENCSRFPVYVEEPLRNPKQMTGKQRPIIIGFGPAGMFAALELIEHGLKPLIFERGKNLNDRHVDVQRFISDRILTTESNIQFGAGGAGSYSDGKLFSRPNNSIYANKVLDTFITFGAPTAIRYISKPHLGTDVLRTIVANIRNHILGHGGEINFNSKMTDILVCKDSAIGITVNDSAQYFTDALYLAIGNSARDTFALLHKQGVLLESKPIAVGVRIEHPSRTINGIRYGDKYRDFCSLGAATYSFTYTNRQAGRGVYTFCMCPGGEVVNASSAAGLLALNGMSYAARDSAFSNSAITVPCTVDDYKSVHPLAGIEFQKEIERRAFIAGGETWQAPAQNLIDFLKQKPSKSLNSNSYKMGTVSADIGTIFPPFIGESLRRAFNQWQTESPLFVADDAILMGPETRTSSPVRVVRGKNFESKTIRNLYPIGEGSGYSGGIISAAIDAIKAVESVIKE